MHKKLNLSWFFRDTVGIYMLWLVCVCFFSVIFIPLLSIGHSSGEQKPLTYLAYTFQIAVYGFFIISILTPFIFIGYFKRNWYLNVIVGLISAFIIIYDLYSRNTYEPFDVYQDKMIINKKELIIKQEYYPNTRILRSKGFFINGKRDSIWRTYDKQGKIIEETVYKNGIAVESRK